MIFENLLLGILLGCSHLMLGLALRNHLLGIIGLVLEVVLSVFSTVASFILFPVILVMMLLGIGQPVTVDTKNRDVCFHVIGCSGPLAGSQYELSSKHPSLEFGTESNDVRLPKGTPGVSRHHCRVTLKDGKPYLMDLNSSYGTFFLVPLQRLQPMTEYDLHDKTEFCLASKAVVFQISNFNEL